MGEGFALALGQLRSKVIPLSSRSAACLVLLLALVSLPGCSELALQKDAAPTAGSPDPAYTDLISEHIKKTFKDRLSYDRFEISGSRWVHSIKGWAWLSCVRFDDRGHQRVYAVFVKDSAIVDSRYAVQTDACDSETYSPFAAMGATMPASIGVQEPLY